MNPKLLELKTISSTQKLILMLIMDYPQFLTFNLTAGDIASKLGTTRKVVIESLGKLADAGFINTKVSAPFRYTELTNEFKQLIEEEG